LVRKLGGEKWGGILTEGREDILIKKCLVRKGRGGEGRGRDFKIILLFYP